MRFFITFFEGLLSSFAVILIFIILIGHSAFAMIFYAPLTLLALVIILSFFTIKAIRRQKDIYSKTLESGDLLFFVFILIAIGLLCFEINTGYFGFYIPVSRLSPFRTY